MENKVVDDILQFLILSDKFAGLLQEVYSINE